MSRRSRDLVAAVDACEYVTIRRQLRGGACPNTPTLGLLPLSVAVETADIACVALLLHFGAAPDQRPAMGQSHTRCTGTGAFSAMHSPLPCARATGTGHATAREYAMRMHSGQHADDSTRVGRQALSGQHDCASRILRLFDDPAGEECSALVTAFSKRLDALEEEERRRESRRHMAAAVAVAVVLFLYYRLLYATGLLSRFGERDQREL